MNSMTSILQRLLSPSIQSALRSPPFPKCPPIQKLPDEIFVNVVFSFLDLRDILNLREVCKWFCDLTHHGVIWKRLLQASSIRIPPLPPLPRYNFDNLTAQEAERLLVKAHSLQRNWQSDGSVPELRSFDFDYCVAEIALLPGGQYLVASISDPTKQNWGIILCSLDSRSGVTLIAKTSTKAKAFQLQARYLNVRGEAGITIAFICRDWVHSQDRKLGNVSEFDPTTRFDPRCNIGYECRVLHIPLSSIPLVPGSIQKARTLSPSFRQLSHIKSRSHILGPLVLDDFHGEPYLALAQDPSQIIFKPLNDSDGPVSVIGLIPQEQYPDAEYRIEAIRPFPQQNQILVARSIQCDPKPLLCFEMHAIPVSRTGKVNRVTLTPIRSVITCRTFQFREVHITDHGASYLSARPRDKESKGTKNLRPRVVRPLPVSIFITSSTPRGAIEHILLEPKSVHMPPPRLVKLARISHGARQSFKIPEYHYKYELTSRAFRHRAETKAPTNARWIVLPGSERTLLLTVPQLACHLPVDVFGMYKLRGQGHPSTKTLKPGRTYIPVEFRTTEQGDHGVSAIAWDDAIGRAVVVKETEGKLKVLDFAHMPVPLEDIHDQHKPSTEHGVPAKLLI